MWRDERDIVIASEKEGDGVAREGRWEDSMRG